MRSRTRRTGRSASKCGFSRVRWRRPDPGGGHHDDAEESQIQKTAARTPAWPGDPRPEEWVCVIKPARILYEMEGVTREVAEEAFRLAAHKLPLKTRFVSREMLEVAE